MWSAIGLLLLLLLPTRYLGRLPATACWYVGCTVGSVLVGGWLAIWWVGGQLVVLVGVSLFAKGVFLLPSPLACLILHICFCCCWLLCKHI